MNNLADIKSSLDDLPLTDFSRAFWERFFESSTPLVDVNMKDGIDERAGREIGVDFIRKVNRAKISDRQKFLIGKAFVERIMPDPDSISNWGDLNNLIGKHTDHVSTKTQHTLARLSKNRDFQSKLSNANKNMDSWSKSVACGEIFLTFLIACTFLRKGRDSNPQHTRSYNKLIKRLKQPLNTDAFEMDFEHAKLFITAHSNFRGDLVAPIKNRYPDKMYTLVAEHLSTPQKVSVQRIMMIKYLKKGVSVFVAADGKKGSTFIKGKIFGNEVSVPDGFAWITWKTNCKVVWAYAKCHQQGAGLEVFSSTIYDPVEIQADYESFAIQIVRKYLDAVETAILQNPFDFGLLYPRRLADNKIENTIKD